MNNKDFDWDSYFSNATFSDVCKNSPDLFMRRPPTTYSPDKTLIYLSSQDYDVEVDNLESLKLAFNAIKASYKFDYENGNKNYLRLWLASIDFIEICGLISKLVETPEEYGDPDSLLELS